MYLVSRTPPPTPASAPEYQAAWQNVPVSLTLPEVHLKVERPAFPSKDPGLLSSVFLAEFDACLGHTRPLDLCSVSVFDGTNQVGEGTFLSNLEKSCPQINIYGYRAEAQARIQRLPL